MSEHQQIKDIIFNTNTIQFAGLTSGKSDTIVLCLHGWLDNAASFIPLINELKNYQVIAIDLPGHGQSSHRSADAQYHFIDWIDDILNLFEVNQWESIHLVGHSMGGMVASAFSAAFPEKVKSLTLIDSIGFIYGDEKDTTKQLRKGMVSRLSIRKSTQTHKKITITKATKARMLVSDLREQDAQLIVTRNLEKMEDGFKWRSDKKLNTISPYRLTLMQAKQLVSDIKVPTQLVYGSRGLDFVRDGIDDFSSLFSNIAINKLEGGHHVHMEKPEATAILIKTFIEKISIILNKN